MGEVSKIAWVQIADAPGYRVSNLGGVQSCWRRIGQGRGKAPLLVQSETWKDLKVIADHYGRSVVSLGRNRRRFVARLVLEAFVGPCPQGMECCHFPDRDPSNCRLDNLRWGTSKDNTGDQRSHGTLVGGEKHGMAKLTDATVARIRRLARVMRQKDVAEIFGTSQSHVSAIVNYKARTPESHAGKGL